MSTAPDTAPDQGRPGSAFRHLVAAEVRAQMARESISNRKFAVKFGLKPAWVDRRLNGTTPMDADDMQFFAESLGVSLDELLQKAIQRASDPQATISYDYALRTLALVADPQVDESAHAATTIAQLPTARATDRDNRPRRVA